MIPFSPPRIDKAVIDEVVDTLNSGWITTGPKTKRFESMVRDYCGCKRVLCVNSATSGLELILRWFGVGVGDEVILPAYTYSATANVVIHCGAKPVLVDVGTDFNINVEKVGQAITSKTKVIMPVDFGGYPCEYSKLNSLVDSDHHRALFVPANDIQKKLGRILILSDSAHSFGASISGKRAGSLTDISVFSFHAVKNLTTAEGGAIALNLPEPFDSNNIYDFLNIFSLHGQNKDALAKLQKGNWKYDIITAGYKCNMTDIQASFGLVELPRYESDTLAKRRYICNKYSQAFADQEWAEIPVQNAENITSSYHLYPLRIKGITEATRDSIISDIFSHDVSVNVHFIPIPMLSFYKDMGYDIQHWPVTYDNFSREISLPVFYDITDDQINKVIDAVKNAVESNLKNTPTL